MNEKKMKEYIEAAKPIAETTGFDLLILLTHAYHESGGFEKVIGLNNFWGVKTPVKSNWNGLAKTVMTHEYENIAEGENYEQALSRISKKYGCRITELEKSTVFPHKWKVFLPQSFRDWADAEEAVKWYVDFIKNVYPSAFTARADYQNYFKRLVEGNIKYATDPAYPATCEDLYMFLKNKFK